jgi:hypothetical protein
VYANNAQKIIRNVTQQQLQTFNNLPATYLQNAKAKAFPIKYAAALMQKLFA